MTETALTLGNSSPAVKDYFRTGNVAALNDSEKDIVLTKLCERYNLDPIMRPFDLLDLRGVQKFYMTAGATNQMANQQNLSRSVLKLEIDETKMLAHCEVRVSSPSGRTEDANAWISVGKFLPPSKDNPTLKRVMLEGEELANALLKLETKTKRRATLSFFGIMDASTDMESAPQATKEMIAQDVEILTQNIETKQLPETQNVGNEQAPAKETKKRATKATVKEEKVEEPKVEAKPLEQTKAKEAAIEANLADFGEPELPPTRATKIYDRAKDAKYLIETAIKIFGAADWHTDAAKKSKVQGAIGKLDGKVPVIFTDTNEVCPEFIEELRKAIS